MTILANITKKGVAGALVAATLATGAVSLAPTEAAARPWGGGHYYHGGGWRGGGWRGGGWGPGIVGGLALGALAAGAYGAYGAPYYGYGGCYITRQRVYDGWGWHWQRVRVCN